MNLEVCKIPVLETDVAVLNEGFFYIQPDNGQVALSRRGDLGVNATKSVGKRGRRS
ncbi:MAG: hypothetical protein ACJ0DF_09665 [Paracoccaceae bacterium]